MAEKQVVTLLNKSARHFDTINADDKAVRHAPGRTEEYTLEQAKQFDPRELVDLSKVPGSIDKESLRRENIDLKRKNAELEAQLAALTPAPAAEPVAAEAVVDEPAPEPEPVEEGSRRNKRK